MAEDRKKPRKVTIILSEVLYERLRKVCYLQRLTKTEIGRIGFEQAIADLELASLEMSLD